MVPAVYQAIEKTVEHLAKHLVIHGFQWIAEKKYRNDIHDFRDSPVEVELLVEKYKTLKERKTEKSK